MYEFIGAGRTAEVFDFGDDKVLKLFRTEYLDLAEKEYEVAKILESFTSAAPKLYGRLVTDGRFGIIYEKKDGLPMAAKLERNPMLIRRYAHMTAALHNAMHTKNIKRLPPIRPRLRDAILRAQALSTGMREAVLRRLEALPDGEKLCHGDFHMGNIMVDGDAMAAIDWLDATMGDPLADVARTYIVLGSPAIKKEGHPMVLRAMRSFCESFARQYLSEYLRLGEIKERDVLLWIAPVAAARMAECIAGEEQYLTGLIGQSLDAQL